MAIRPKPHRGARLKRPSVINYHMPTDLRISEGIGTTVIVPGHRDYTLCDGGGGRRGREGCNNHEELKRSD